MLYYTLFDKQGAYKVLSLRNGGSDTDYLMFKDMFIHNLDKGEGLRFLVPSGSIAS